MPHCIFQASPINSLSAIKQSVPCISYLRFLFPIVNRFFYFQLKLQTNSANGFKKIFRDTKEKSPYRFGKDFW